MTVTDGLGARGASLWESLARTAGTPDGELALEACRTADRLEHLDRIILGKGVLDLLTFRLDLDTEGDDGRNVNVRVGFSDVMAEARQQQNNLRQMLVTLGLKAGAPAAQKGSVLDEFTARRQGRDGAGSADADAPRSTRARTAARRRR